MFLFRSAFVLVAVLTCANAEEVRAGYTDNPPQMVRDLSGRPSGFVVDALNEAARREGIPLRWVWLERNAVPAALRSGTVDLWPAGVRTADREREFHVTEGWWHGQAIILSRMLHNRTQLPGRRIGHTRATASAVRAQLPQVIPVLMDTTEELADAMCRGDLDGILSDRMVLDALLLDRPPACAGLKLALLGDVGVSTELGIIARRDRRSAADSLRQSLQSMTGDGTLARLAIQYPGVSAGSTQFVAAMVEQRYRVRALQVAAVTAFTLLIAAAFIIRRLRRDLRLRRQAEDELRRRNDDLEQFAYASHHDLREPLRNMAIFSQMLQRKGRTHPDAEKHLSYISSGATRMQEMLDAIRNYTQYAVGSARSNVYTSADGAFETARANLVTQLTAAGVTVTADTLPHVPFVREHLIQIFQNLLSNAVKYRRADAPVIRVRCNPGDNEFVFSVEDNGIGIPPEYHERVFGMFKRLHGREVAGTGIGLAICRKIVENNGGRMWLESVPGQGSVFFFTVPRDSRKRQR